MSSLPCRLEGPMPVLRLALSLVFAGGMLVAAAPVELVRAPQSEEVNATHGIHGVSANPWAAPEAADGTVVDDDDALVDAEGEGEEDAGLAPETTKTIVSPLPQTTSAGLAPDGVGFSLRFQGDTSTGSSTPPDPSMAAGPSDLLVTTNQHIKVFDKSGANISSKTVKNFFSGIALPGQPIVDVMTLYDPYINRFWIAAKNNDHLTNAMALVGLSDTSSAAGTWTLFPGINLADFGGFVHNEWCDYLRIGFDPQGVYLTCNMQIDGGPMDTAVIRAFTKQEFLDNNVTAWWNQWNIDELSTGNRAKTVHPAIMIDAVNADGEYFVSTDKPGGSGDHLSVRRVKNVQYCCDGNPNTKPTLKALSVKVGSYSVPPRMDQPGPLPNIVTLNTTVRFAFWRQNALSLGHHLACSGRSCVNYTQLNTSNFPTSVTVVDDFAIGGPDADRSYGGVNSAGDGWKTLAYAKSNSSTFLEIDAIAIPPTNVCTNCTSGSEITLQPGFSGYVVLDGAGRNRWGDYFTVAPDPDSTHLWVHGEYPISFNTFGTEVIETTAH